MSASPPEPTASAGRRVPRLLAISSGHALPWGEDLDLDLWIERQMEAGVDAVQLREKQLDDRRLFEIASRARNRLPPEVLLLVNGRVDIALAARADGVHLPAAGLSVAALRRRFGPALVIGRSTHAPGEVATARDEGADYATFGPVFATPSKAAYGAPPGLAGLREATAAGLPVLALGGVGAGRLAEVAAAGAAGAAGIRAFQGSSTELAELVRWAREVFC